MVLLTAFVFALLRCLEGGFDNENLFVILDFGGWGLGTQFGWSAGWNFVASRSRVVGSVLWVPRVLVFCGRALDMFGFCSLLALS